MTFHGCFLPSLDLFGKAVSEKKIFLEINQSCLLTVWDEMSNLYTGPAIDASYQISGHLAMRFQRRRFVRNQPIRKKKCTWRPCLLTDLYEMSNLYSGHVIDASYHVPVHLVKQFQRWRFVRNQPIRSKNRLWRPCLLTDHDEMSIIYTGPAIDASYQVLVHLAKRFQRRRFSWNQPIRNKKCLWRKCLLTHWGEMRNLYRGPAINASY